MGKEGLTHSLLSSRPHRSRSLADFLGPYSPSGISLLFCNTLVVSLTDAICRGNKLKGKFGWSDTSTLLRFLIKTYLHFPQICHVCTANLQCVSR